MKSAKTAVALALVLSLAACDGTGPNARLDREWQLTREGAQAGQTRVPIPGWIWTEEPYACMPALAVGPKGEAVVTSNVVPVLWRIDPETLAVTEHRLVLDADTDKDVGFSGLVYSPDHAAFFALSEVDRAVWRIDPLLRRGQKIPLGEPMAKACGLAMRVGLSARKPARFAGLCALGPDQRWSIHLAPDQRSAYARSASPELCPESRDAIRIAARTGNP